MSAWRNAALFLVAVAYAVERFDRVEIVGHHLALLAQALDVAVYGAVIDIKLVVIGSVHLAVAAFEKAGALRQRLQDKEFGDGEADRLAVPGAFMPLGIERQLAPHPGFFLGF